ncbi:MAG: IclR family transcriptional regulator [Lachnospiraceae bacterium]|nr:IclR family transcriptional regulator [Lachnospiraceae bacterium]
MEEKNPIQVADRLFQTLELLAKKGSMALMEVSKELNLHKSTVHRILNSLLYLGYVRQEAESGKYSLTFKLVELSTQILEHQDILKQTRPYLKQLMEQTGETVHLVQLDGYEAVYIDKVEAYQNSIRLVSRVGSRIPLYCSGVGKALAATMSDSKLKQLWDNSVIEKKTPHTITDFAEFSKCVAEVRQKGYAEDREENELGIRCIATALCDYTGAARYAFSISAPVSRMPDERVQELAGWIQKTRQMIEREM